MLEIGENLQFANYPSEVDRINTEFYNKIKYPWAPNAFERVRTKKFWHKMMSHDLGYWYDTVLPKNCQIWVAGCGTNQAIFTAMRFPDAFVMGSDLSRESLEICKKNAETLNISNLELRNESINNVNYSSRFDYIISTGVIHHNSDPIISLQKLSKALKPLGVMELMVYNKFHRINTAAFQLAVRILTQCDITPNLEKELPIARMIVNSYQGTNKMKELFETIKNEPEAAFTDSLLQPVEHSYTVESLENIVSECGLELLVSRLDQFSHAANNIDWNLRFKEDKLQDLYDSLPDTRRWYITNLLQQENSPMLWFYLQKRNCPRLRKSEKQICEEFLNTKFKRTNLEKDVFILNENGTYDNKPITVNFPVKRFLSKEVEQFYDQLNEDENIKETFKKCAIKTSFSAVNFFRISLATSGNPFLEVYS